MNSQPFFTVGLPAYKVEKYLAACLDSVLSQGFTDFEIIAVNDGSPDNSSSILDEYAAKDSRIKVVHRKNCGVSAARNTVLFNATGKYLYFFDSDDLMCEDALQNAYDCIVKENFPDVLHTGFVKYIGGKEIVYTAERPGEKYFAPELTKDDRLVMMWTDKVFKDPVCTRFIKTELVRQCGILFVTNYVAQEDNDFDFNLYRKADTVVYADFPSFIYNKYREASASTEWSSRAIASVFCRWYNFFNSDWRFYDLTPTGLKYLEMGRKDFVYQIRRGILLLSLSKTKEEQDIIVPMLEKYFEKEIRKLPVGRDKFAPMYLSVKLLGSRKTVAIIRTLGKIMKRGVYAER